jgi:hypothetical protein
MCAFPNRKLAKSVSMNRMHRCQGKRNVACGTVNRADKLTRLERMLWSGAYVRARLLPVRGDYCQQGGALLLPGLVYIQQ